MKNKDYNLEDENIISPDSDESENQGNPLDFIQKNRNIIIIVSLVIIIGIAAIMYFNNKSESDSQRASVLITRVMEYYESGDYEKALNGDPERTYMGEQVKGLKYIADEFGSTEQGKIASLYTANIYVNTSKHKEAVKYFENAQKASSDVVVMGAVAGLASCYELDNKYSEAAKMYLDASKMTEEDNIKTRYLFYSGLCYEKSGDKKEAENQYREILKISEFGEFSPLAKSGLIRIGTIIE